MEAVLLRAGAGGVREARRALSADLVDADISEEQVFDVVLVAAELIGNAMSHARPMPDGAVRVQWDLRDRRARIEVHDGGGPTVPTLRPADSAQPDGRGLAIVAALADSWGYERREGCCVVWAELILKTPH